MASATFTPERLTVARMRRGLSKVELATRIGVSPRMITEYEAGRSAPSQETLDDLSRELAFPRAFFGAPPIEPIPEHGASFRALTSMKAGERNTVLAAASIAMEVTRLMEAEFTLPAPQVPDLRDASTPEAAATELRAQWKIGLQSIPNLLHLAEAHGIRVFSLSGECARSVDGFSVWGRETPFIFLNPTKSGERGRYDLAHEIGHLVLHRHGGPRGRSAETEANQFASAFLMPRDAVLPVVPSLPSVSTLLELKPLWKVSVAAMVRRLHDLERINDWTYQSMCIEIARRGWRTSEPNGIPRETSLVLAQVFAELRAQGTQARAAFAREVHITVAELDSLVFGLAPSALEGGSVSTGLRSGETKLRLVNP